MPINDHVNKYLTAFRNKKPFPGGLSFQNALGKSNLDNSVESLDRVDYLLDQIRTRFNPEFGEFLSNQANQNFLYLLCFYVGDCIASNSNQKIVWLPYDEMTQTIPNNAALFPDCFATSITCILEKTGFFVPMSSIQERLFDEPPEKSVAFSARGAMHGWL